MAKSCCCYVVDVGYMVPTLVSATQVREHTSKTDTDVRIFCLNSDASVSRTMRAACSALSINYRDFEPSTIDNWSIMFGRFFLHRLLDQDYKGVLYIDGDTQVLGSLDPLLNARLEPGTVAAARDPMSVIVPGPGQSERLRYFASIGVSVEGLQRYFNSGVLRFEFSDIEEIGRAVMQVASRQGSTFRFPDQDPLNIAYGSKYLTLSYKWNFPAFFLGANLDRLVPPRICHFMSNPRPWDGPFLPWGRGWSRPYTELLDRFPDLRPFAKKAGYLQYAKYLLQQRYKRLFEIPAWMSNDVTRKITAVERECYV